MDELNLKIVWGNLWGYFLRPPALATKRINREPPRFNLWRIYRHDIPQLLKSQKMPFGVIFLATIIAIILGIVYARQYPIPPEAFPLQDISAETFESMQRIRFLPSLSTTSIFLNNLRVMILAMLISVFSFGALTLFLTLINMGLVGFLVTQIISLGYNPGLFVVAFILPHGF
ncbi:MAG: stage II sporulation protein M, partial [Deltaproteobacteria bacterium]|nr:stage II sporulation protein M [Deltaproteobacteria bacterium]